MWSKQLRTICALGVGFLCIAMASPALAHTGSLWGIDLTSVITLRDQARVMAHTHREEEPGEADRSNARSDELENVRTIVLDPGHGGNNSGATGLAGVAEKELTLELAYQVREKLQEKYPDLRVVMTRYWDTTVELKDRVHIANLANADLFMSLHYNAAPHDRALGFETYFLEPSQVTPGSEEVAGNPLASADMTVTGIEAPIEGTSLVGQRGATVELIKQDLSRAHRHHLSGTLAETIQNHFVETIDSVDRGVKQANFAVLQGAHMPAVVVEAGFLTHPEEGYEVLTTEHRSLVTESLIGAVEDFDARLGEEFDDEFDEGPMPQDEDDEPQSEDDPSDTDKPGDQPIAACCGSH